VVVLIASFPSGPWQTNCYVLAAGPGEPCLIIDPGQGSASAVREVVAENRLLPAAVLLTHGHIDHVWSVTPIARGFGIPALIHGDDRYRLNDIIEKSVMFNADQLRSMMQSDLDLTEPDDVQVLTDGQELEIIGLSVQVVHAPGHTEGSVVFTLPAESTMFSGDVLFAGSIGRTDLPGGDSNAMVASLAKVLALAPDDMRVLPGHGDETTIAHERSTNPYLQGLKPPPTRGM
jgi:hydroxyacylglutathione hydrolase